MGLGFFATAIGVFCYSGDISYGNGVFCNGASWGGFFAAVPRGLCATVPACRGFYEWGTPEDAIVYLCENMLKCREDQAKF